MAVMVFFTKNKAAFSVLVGFVTVGLYVVKAQPRHLVTLSLVGLGATSLWFRQTNVFWVTLFPAALASLDALRSSVPVDSSLGLVDVVRQSMEHGLVFDPPLKSGILFSDGEPA